MAIKARDVMDPDVDDERMTCRKGWSSAGVSKVLISVQASALVSVTSFVEGKKKNSNLCNASNHFSTV